MNKKRALISVFNKDGIVELAKSLINNFNFEIISTGGSRETLKSAGINCEKISTLTDYPEMLDGRVKTLHPKIHGAILADRSNKEHMKTLKEHNIQPIDLVIVNLYPFREVASIKNSTLDRLIENIDIGGAALIRSAAKNYHHVTVVCSNEDYEELLEDMDKNDGKTSMKFRKKLAAKAFEHTHTYDNIVYQTLLNRFDLAYTPESFKIELTKVDDLRYGENPHQSAGLYNYSDAPKDELAFEVLQGKELSYNNLIDVTSALKVIDEFNNIPAACIIKHCNPCGVAIGKTHLEAFKKALSADPISSFGGIVGINGLIDADLADIMTSVFLEVIVANKFSDEARLIFNKKKNLRLIEVPEEVNLISNHIIKQIAGGVLIQNADNKMITQKDFNIVTKKKPSEAELDDLLFAWKVVKHINSNAIVVAKNGQTLGIGCGQTSRIGSMEIALRQACDEAKDAVVASDGFIPAIDNIQAAVQARISSIIQPGGSIKDKEVIATADKYNLSMVFTGVRHFKH